MAEYKIQGETLTAIADAIRSKVGATAKLTPAQMAGYIEAVQLQEKTVTPTEEVQEVTPDAGYFGLSKVTVGAAVMSEELPSVLDYYFGNAGNTIEKAVNFTDKTQNGNSNEIGFSFTPTESMAIYGIWAKYTKSDSVCKVWDSGGNILYQKPVKALSAWTDIMFDAPVNLVPGSKYVISINNFSSHIQYYAGITYSGKLTSAKQVTGTAGAMPTGGCTHGAAFSFYIGPAAVDSQPEEYEVTRSTMDEIATEVMRISGTTDKMTVAQMQECLESVVGEVLPDVEGARF